MKESPKLVWGQQIETFHVGRFRGLSDITLEGAGQVNLVVGGNNSGKTSILEALAVYSKPLDVFEWTSVARMREVRGAPIMVNTGLSAVDAVRWLFQQESRSDWDRGESSMSLASSGPAAIRSLNARCLPIKGIPPEPRYASRTRPRQADLDEEEGWHLSIQVEADLAMSGRGGKQLGFDLEVDGLTESQDGVRLDIDLWPSAGHVRPARTRGPQIPSATLSPYSHRNQPMQLRLLSKVVSAGNKSALLDLLRGVDENLLDLEIITEAGDRPLLTALLSDQRRVPVTVLGDGFRRALSIAMAMNQVQGGLLLIDEIETALHISALGTLFPWLLKVAHETGVQVFATTHSLEAIQAITAAAEPFGDTGITAFHLPSRTNPSSKLKRYTGSMLNRLVRERGLDIR